MKRRISYRGLTEIQRYELFVNHPYQDEGGVWTIGFGHTKGVNQSSRNITREQGIKLLYEDLDPVQDYINENFELNQNQFDALCSLLFNVGVNALIGTRLYNRLKEDPDDRHVAYEWIEFCLVDGRFSRGLIKRRCKEIEYYYS